MLVPVWSGMKYALKQQQHTTFSLMSIPGRARFFIMFGRDPRLPLTELFQHKLRYLGTDETVLSLQALRNMYLVIAENLHKARERSTTPYPKQSTPI